MHSPGDIINTTQGTFELLSMLPPMTVKLIRSHELDCQIITQTSAVGSSGWLFWVPWKADFLTYNCTASIWNF